MSQPIIEIQGMKNCLGGQWVHTDVNLTVEQGEILAIIGGSGSGKTTILRSILMLLKPTAGSIKVFGKAIDGLNDQQALAIRRRWGMLFQHSALFSAMSVLDNVMFPMREFTSLDEEVMRELALLKIALVGLSPEAAEKFPAELSGGMQRRAAAARAIAMDPELLFLDEPTTGLDPRGARLFDELVVFLRNTLKLTVVMISHDIESLQGITDRVAFVGEGKILAVEPIQELMRNKNPVIVDYFSNVIKK
ncbi:MAG: ABC transporter ATP-binding protein [Legionella sp.]|nr:MAG: ABC transporter ATP-binding protein [Legionella sp.]PJD98617.1 MAG: ABC transporter ATP-binding protein [Legionella sp.]